MEHIESQENKAEYVLTSEDLLKIKATYELGQRLRSQQMNLHLRPVSEFGQWPVEEKRQALIEWKLSQSSVPDLDSHQELLWDFHPNYSPEARMAVVKRYEAVIDQWRDWLNFERPEMKVLVSERINALHEAILANSTLSLNDILSKPGFERFKLTDPQAKTLEINTQTFKLHSLEVTYPNVLLYELFNYPPSFLQREEINVIHTSTESSIALKGREQLFVNWLTDSAKNCPDGWLTLERFNELRANVNRHKKGIRDVTSTYVRQLLLGLRKYPEYRNSIENAERGNAWRLTNWQRIRVKR